jgi:hypothetical protein
MWGSGLVVLQERKNSREMASVLNKRGRKKIPVDDHARQWDAWRVVCGVWCVGLVWLHGGEQLSSLTARVLHKQIIIIAVRVVDKN